MAESSSASARPSSSASLIGHETRGVGYASRFRVSKDNLPPGWRAEKKSSKCTVWFDEKGNYYRSSLDVERALRERELLLPSDVSETETETGGETSEYEPSPVKRPRAASDVPV